MAPIITGSRRHSPGADTTTRPTITTVISPIHVSNWLPLAGLDRHGSEIEPYGYDDGTGHHRRHQTLNPAPHPKRDGAIQRNYAIQHASCHSTA